MTFVRLAPEQHDTIPDVPEPAENPRLFGHEEAAAQLMAAYRAGKLHHALLIAGPPGIGKATFAFHLAYTLLAHPRAGTAPDGFERPDATSALFRQIAQGSHPSILHLTRPLNEKTKTFKSVVTVDEIRRVNRFLAMTSHDGAYRVVIVDPADDMNTNAANALLKTLEEPPARTLFVLISHSLGSLLPTIRSRCQLIKLKPLAAPDLLAALRSGGVGLPDEGGKQEELAQKAGGSVRDALLMTQFGGLDIGEAVDGVLMRPRYDHGEVWRIAEAVSGRDSAIQFDIFNQQALDRAAAWAREAALGGDLDTASKASDLWNELDRTIAEMTTFNLDKKQHAAGVLRRMWGFLHG